MEPTANPPSSPAPDSTPPATPPPPPPPTPQPPAAPPDPGISQTFEPDNDGAAPLPPPYSPATEATPPASPMPPASLYAPPANELPSPLPPQPEQPAPSVQPVIQPTVQPVIQPAVQPAVTVGDGGMPSPASAQVFTPTNPVAASASRRGFPKFSKKLLIPIVAVVAVVGSASAFYFGYYMNPSVIYSQSLKNTGKGYDKLVDFADKQQKLTSKSYVGTGSYKVKFADFSTDGKINFKGAAGNDELTFDVGLGAARVNADIRTIKSSGNTPDVYVKAGDIKGLGTVIGVPDLDTSLAKLDNTWIVIDHTLIDNLDSIATAQAQADSEKMQGPTSDQVFDEARAFGKVDQQYLFSTAKDKAVTKVVKKYGIETVDGHKTYHYKIALQPANVKKYIYAQRDALKASSFNDWLKKNKYDQDVYKSFNNAADSTKDIKTTDTYDIWMDVSHRIIYKIRFNEKENPATNYVDVGLNYKGGDTFPLFISGQFKDNSTNDTFSFVTTLDTKTSDTDFKLKVDTKGSDSASNGTVTADFNFKPSASPVKIAKPANAVPLSQILSELGLGDLLSQYTSVNAGIQDKATDSKRITDLASLQTQLEAFFQNTGYYPSRADMNSNAWLSAHMKTLDRTARADPANPGHEVLVAAPAAKEYAYTVTNSKGGSCEANDTKCAKYTLTATLATPVNGQKTYSKSNLD